MSANIAFASKPFNGVAAVSTANTNRDGTGTIVDILGASPAVPAAGILLQRIAVQATGNPADSVVTIFLHNGTSYFLFDEFDIGDPAAASTTLPGYRFEKVYNDIPIPFGWKLAAAITVALTTGVVNVFAFAGDLT